MLSAQNIEETISYADRCLGRADLSSAIDAYSRALFFSPDSLLPMLFVSIGQCYEESGDHPKAAYYYQRAVNAATTDSFRVAHTFDKVRCELHEKEWLIALADIYSLPDTTSREVFQRKSFFLGVIFFGLEDYEASAMHFTSCLPEGHEPDSVAIMELLTNNRMMVHPIPKRAATLSAILPGLGQAYAGDIESALNSFILNSGLVSLGLYVAFRQGWLQAAVTVLPWYQRYFTGGMTNARDVATRRLAIRQAEVYQQVLQVISTAKEI